MSLLDLLYSEETWAAFARYKASLALPKKEAADLARFIREKQYLPICASIEAGNAFPLPRKAVISKMSASKKRVVYIYPEPENTFLKGLTHLLLRSYDGLFTDDLYSFRPGRTAQKAVRRLLRAEGADGAYAYKADIHDYFNSIPVERLLPLLEETLAGDRKLYAFLAGLLTEKRVVERGRIIEERKGIMAGTPLSAFYANLYLSGLDEWVRAQGVPYARYSDDIILFARTRAEAECFALRVKDRLTGYGLEMNPAKEMLYAPEDGYVFLGFEVRNGEVDIAPATCEKLKGKMRRKRDALRRWAERGGFTGEQAASAFIRIFNRKLLESAQDNDLTWSNWFFAVISRTGRLHEIDLYAQDCIRYLISGKHTKARFNVRYEDMKKLGYRSLVHAYYEHGRERGTREE